MTDSSAVRYQIVLVGSRPDGQETPAQILQRVLGMDPKRAADVARTLPAVVGTTPNPEHARIHAERLKQAGLQVEVREHPPAVQRATAPGPAPAAPPARPPAVQTPPAAPSPPATAAAVVPPTTAPERTPQAAPAPEGQAGGYALGDLDLAVRPAPKPAAPASPPPAAPASPAADPKKAAPPDAFSGLRNFEDAFGAEPEEQGAPLELENTALRPAKAAAGPVAARAPKKLGLGARIQQLLQALGAWLMSWVPHTIAFCIVVVISAAAVCFGLDPDHILDDVAMARAQSSAQQLMDRASQLLPQ